MKAATIVSTDNLTARDRAPQWCEWINQSFYGLESDLYGDTEFEGRMTRLQAGDVILTRLEANRHRVKSQAQTARASDAAYLKIVAPWHGSAAVEQQGRRASTGAGKWVIYDTTGSYAVENPERAEHLIVMLPKEKMLERGVKLDTLMARQVGTGTGISRVALETMRSTWQELPSMSEDAARGAGELIMQLVQLSLLELAGKTTYSTQREALKDRIQAYIGRNLRDPRLSVDGIAYALNCSKRHLHNAFTEEDETLSNYILQQRLEACIRDLKKSDLLSKSITDIAVYWGFSNLSHFSRVFRDRTGQTPSAYRSIP